MNTKDRSGAEPRPSDVVVPHGAGGIVLVAHGSGRRAARMRMVWEMLQHRRLATLLVELPAEAAGPEGALAHDVAALSHRLIEAIDALRRSRADLAGLPLGILAPGFGAAAALVVAAERPRDVAAVVSHGGRPDLAGTALGRVRAPTLLVHGALDADALAPNRSALAQMSCEKRLEVIPRATQLFEEAGTIERVASAAAEWFVAHLTRPQAS